MSHPPFLKPTSYQAIYAIVNKIPKGRVATYGQVAQLAGLGGQARQVGYALSALPDTQRVPWQRVVNARGEISLRAVPHFEQEQRALLEKEGVVFNSKHRIPLDRFQWSPKNKL